MKKRIIFLALAILFLPIWGHPEGNLLNPSPALSNREEANSEYRAAMALLDSGAFPEAIEKFEQLVGHEYVGGDLFYNLGIAYFRQGDLGKAVWAFEFARFFLPRHPDVRFNLAFVRKRTTDQIEMTPSSVITERVFSWILTATEREWWWATVVFWSVAWTSFSFFILGRKKVWRNTGVIFACLTVAACAGLLTHRIRFANDAVIVSKQTSIRSGPAESSTELFQLNEGTKVDIQAREEGYLRVVLGDGKTGWVDQKTLRGFKDPGL